MSIERKEYSNLKYVLGIFNSKLLNYFYTNIVEEIGRVFAQIKTFNVKRLPFIITNDETQNKIVLLVDQMLEKQKIEVIDKQIDEIVYKLYGLTDEEIRIVEEKE